MPKKEIVIRIPLDGSEISIDQEGMKGKECSSNVDALIDKLGKRTESKKKAEYYRRDDVHINLEH